MILYDRLKPKYPFENYLITSKSVIDLINGNRSDLARLAKDQKFPDQFFVEWQTEKIGCYVGAEDGRLFSLFFTMRFGKFALVDRIYRHDEEGVTFGPISMEDLRNSALAGPVDGIVEYAADDEYLEAAYWSSILLLVAIESGALKSEETERTKVEIKKARRGRRQKPSPYRYVSLTSLGRELVGERQASERGETRAHFVRRHPRRLTTGKITWVKAHVRGKGDPIRKTTKVGV